MKRKSLKLLASALLITVMGAGMIGCGNSSSSNDVAADKGAETKQEESISG